MCHADYPKLAGPKDMSRKILFGLVILEEIWQCMNKLAWLKRAFSLAKPFWKVCWHGNWSSVSSGSCKLFFFVLWPSSIYFKNYKRRITLHIWGLIPNSLRDFSFSQQAVWSSLNFSKIVINLQYCQFKFCAIVHSHLNTS